MFDRAPREAYALIEEKCGRVVAYLSVWICVLAAWSVGLAAIGLLAVQVKRHIVVPYALPLVHGVSFAPGAVAGLWSLAAVLAVVGVIGYLIVRKILAWQRFTETYLDQLAFSLKREFAHLAEHAPSLESTQECTSYLLSRINELEARVPSGLLLSNKDALIRKLREPRIKKVGEG